MIADRETVYAALFALVGTATWAIPGFTPTTWLSSGRRPKIWSAVDSAEQPAFFQVQKNEVVKQKRGLPAQYTLHVDLVVYVNSGNDDSSPAQLLNPILDAIDQILLPTTMSPDGHMVQTLGGVVDHAWIEGKIETDEGALGPQSVAIIPVCILVV